MRILTRYILKNFFESFFLGFTIFTFIIILTSQLYQVIKWLVEGVYGFWEVIKYLVFISPMYLNYVLPLSVVFGVVGSVGKLSANFEITAVNSYGISSIEIFKKLFIIVLFISCLHFFINEFIANKYISKALDMYYSASKEIRGSVMNFSFSWDGKKSISYVFAREYVGDLGLMKDVFIVEKDKLSKYVVRTINSSFAKKKESNIWLLYNVVIYDYVEKKRIFVDSIEYKFELDNNDNNGQRKMHREEVSFLQLLKMAREYKNSGFADLAFEMYVKIHLKFIFPFSSIFLLFLVFPFSLSKVRVSSFLGIVLSVSVAIAYYILITFVQILTTKTGVIWFLWLPNFVSIFLGGIFIFLKNKNLV